MICSKLKMLADVFRVDEVMEDCMAQFDKEAEKLAFQFLL